MDSSYLWVALILSSAGFIHGFIGFGAMLLALPLLSLLLDIKTVIPLGALVGLLVAAIIYWQMRSQLEWSDLWPMFLAALPGIMVGGLLAKILSHQVLSWILGCALILYSSFRLLFASHHLVVRARGWPYFFGFLSGLLGGSLSAGGPPAVIYTSLKDWRGDRIKATLQAFFLVTDIVIMATHAVLGLTTTRVLSLFGVSLAFVFLGTCLGSLLYGKVSERFYRHLLLIVLVLMGMMMIYRA